MRMHLRTGLALCAALLAVPAYADPVSDWNAIAVRHIQGDPSAGIPAGRPGPAGLLDMALVHLAVHDAVQAIERRYQPYYHAPAQPAAGAPEAAVAAAAHRMLVLLYPGEARQQLLDATYEAYLAQYGLEGDPGLDAGEAAAVALHGSHYRPAIPMAPFFGVEATGQWRSQVAMAAPFLAFITPYTLNRPSHFRPPPPPPLASEVYLRDYEEVRLRGGTTAHADVNDANTDMALFWTSVNYFTRWPETVRQIAAPRLGTGDSARLFALVGLSAADAIIAIWDSKYFYNFWRPSTAIPEGDHDGNHRTIGDPAWLPYRNNPPYPDYVSGANGLSAAILGALQSYFGTDEMTFSVKNPDPGVPTQERHYTRFSDAAAEVVEARLLIGIHFRAANEEGRKLGARVAQWVAAHYLRPVPGR